jgi:hypothetical protein
VKKTKAQVHVFAALLRSARPPLALLGLDSDKKQSSSTIISPAIASMRDSPSPALNPIRKNDSCFVEQKNWTVVCQSVGYARYDTPEGLDLLNEIYSTLRLI